MDGVAEVEAGFQGCVALSSMWRCGEVAPYSITY